MDIYWIKDKQRRGPATVPDVISQLQTGELTPDTLGWHTGCSEWKPLRELPSLSDFLNKAASPQESEGEEAAETPVNEEPATKSAPSTRPAAMEERSLQPDTPEPLHKTTQEGYVSQRVYLPSPTARLLARFVDCGLYAVLYGSIIYLQGIPYDASLILSVNPLLWLPMLILEAWMLSTWGTTPGKMLMGIRVTAFGDDVTRLSFVRALLRSCMVFCFGMGLMIPQILIIMLTWQFWMLRRRGISSWDARCSTLPTQKEPSTPSRYVLAVILLYVSAVLFFSCMKPWMPGMIEDIGKENPEMAQTLRELMPKEAEAPTPAPSPTPAPAAETPPAPVAPLAPQDLSLPGI